MQAQADHETAYRQLLIQGVLALLLPTEDLENECLTSLVGQIVSELIVGNLVVNKLSEPWLLMEICIMLTRLAKGAPQSTSPVTPEQGNLSNSNPSKIQQTKGRKGLALHHHFWSLVQWGFLAVNSIRLFINLVVLSWSLRPRSTTLFVEKPNVTDQHSQGKPFKPLTSSISRHAPVRAPIAEFKVWTFVANLLEMDARMPWLVGAISMVQWTSTRGLGRIAGYDGVVDR